MRYKCLIILCLLPLFFYTSSFHVEAVESKQRIKRGIMDNFGDGLKIAGQMFGINTAADVANLVAKAFSSTRNRNKPDLMSIFQQRQQHPNSQQQSNESYEQQTSEQHQQESSEAYPTPTQRPTPTTPVKEELNVDFSATKLVTNMLRMIGFDATKLGALAINALIMIAQAIGNTFMSTNSRKDIATTSDNGRRYAHQQTFSHQHHHDDEGEPEALRGQAEHQPRSVQEDAPLDWFLDQPNARLKKMLAEAMDEQLTDRITQMIEQAETEAGQGACLKMLMCKSAPIIWGMQRSVNERIVGKSTEKPQHSDTKANTAQEQQQKWLSTEMFFTHFPSLDEFRAHGQQCEQRFSAQCNTTRDFAHK